MKPRISQNHLSHVKHIDGAYDSQIQLAKLLRANREECPLWAPSGHLAKSSSTSAFGGKADVILLNIQQFELPVSANGRPEILSRLLFEDML